MAFEAAVAELHKDTGSSSITDKELNLSVLGQQIVQLFSDCCAPVPEPQAENDHVQHSIESEKDRFDLWAVNMGLFLKGHASLDYRLRDADGLKDTIYTFLKTLSTALGEALDYVLHYSMNEAESLEMPNIEDGSPPESLTEEDLLQLGSDQDLIVDSITDSIDRLYKVSIWIRSPSSRTINPKALRHTQIDEETKVDWLRTVTAFDNDFVDSVLRQCRSSSAVTSNQVSDDSISMTAPDSWLRDRIVRCIHDRRQLFSYWHKHHLKLEYHSSIELEIRQEAPMPQAVPVRRTGVVSLSTPSIMHTVTTATNLDVTRYTIEPAKSTVSVSEYAPSMISASTRNEKVQFPAPPSKSLVSGDYFECPYCYTLCPSTLLGVKAWKAHLIHDLRPYICTYRDCLQPYYMYDSVAEWVQHEDSHRPVIVEHSEEADRPCPVCLDNLPTEKRLQSHLARHLERFALFSFPRVRFQDDDHPLSDQAAAHSEASSQDMSSSSDKTEPQVESVSTRRIELSNTDTVVSRGPSDVKVRIRRIDTHTDEQNWIDEGDGYCVMDTIDHPSAIRIVYGTVADTKKTDLKATTSYNKIEDTILVMKSSSQEVEMVLEFYEQRGCDAIWSVIAGTLPIQRKEETELQQPQEIEQGQSFPVQLQRRRQLKELTNITEHLNQGLSAFLVQSFLNETTLHFVSGLQKLQKLLGGLGQKQLHFEQCAALKRDVIESVTQLISEAEKYIPQHWLRSDTEGKEMSQITAQTRFEQMFLGQHGRQLVDRLEQTCQFLEIVVDIGSEADSNARQQEIIKQKEREIDQLEAKLKKQALLFNVFEKLEKPEDLHTDDSDTEGIVEQSGASMQISLVPDWLVLLYTRQTPETPFQPSIGMETSRLFAVGFVEQQSNAPKDRTIILPFDENIEISIDFYNLTCTQTIDGERKSSRHPIQALGIQRRGRSLTLYPSTSTWREPWAVLRFDYYERMMLFFCAFLALQYEGITFAGPTIDAPMVMETKEFELFQADIDPSLPISSAGNIVQVFRDTCSYGIRLQVTEINRQPHGVKYCPLWTAFINRTMEDHGWINQDRTNARRIHFNNLVVYGFTDHHSRHSGPDKRHSLLFIGFVDADKFIRGMARLREGRYRPPEYVQF